MKIKKTVLGLGLIGTLAVGLIAYDVIRDKKEVVEASAYSNQSVAQYYASVDLSSGEALLASLRTINKNNLHDRVGYDDMFSSGAYYKTDPGNGSNQITGFYRGTSGARSAMNREHVWPASRTVGGRDKDPLEDDIHMTRPTFTSDNSNRGNKHFAEVGDSNGWDPASLGNASYRGDAARIIFYCVVADDRLDVVDNTTATESSHKHGKLSDLIAWNLRYPVTAREQTRNTEAEKLQGNKNPFIDHPEYVCKIWGNTNATTQALCANQPEPTPPSVQTEVDIRMKKADGTYFKMPKTYSIMDLNDYALLYPFVNNSVDATATWTFANANGSEYDGPASIIKNADGSVRVSSTEKTAIKITATKDGVEHSFTLYLGMAAPSNGCGGNIAISSSIIASLSLLGVGLILVKKFKTEKE